MNTGFPEECLLPQSFDFNGPDNRLDVVGIFFFNTENLVLVHKTPCVL